MSAKVLTNPSRLWAFRLILLVLAPLLTLLLIEVGLRTVGVGYETSFLVEDEKEPDKMRNNDAFSGRFFPKVLARSPQPLRISKVKPDKTYRIVVLGGSAAMGDPQPAFGMPRLLERLLSHRHPEKRFEVVNAAVTAINSHVVLPILEDCLELEPDVIIVYMGNNEVNGPYGSGSVFGSRRPSLPMIRSSLAIQNTRLGQWMASLASGADKGIPSQWGGLKMFMEQQVALDAPDLERVYANFRGNLTDMLKLGRRAKVPVLVSSVAVNLEDWAPFMSAGDPDNADEIKAHLASQRWLEAEEACRSRVETNSGSANLHYWLGLSLKHQDKLDEAELALQRACDRDTLRFRADSKINAIIREVVPSEQLVDGEAILAKADSNGISGKEWFHEHVHLTFSGNYHLSLAFAQGVEKVLAIKNEAPWLTENACAREMGFTPFHHREVVQEMQGRLRTPPFDGQFGQAELQAVLANRIQELSRKMTPAAGQQAIADYQRIISQRPGDWVSRQQFAVFLSSMGKEAEAAIHLEAAKDVIPHDAAIWFQLGASRNRLQEWESAETALREAIRLRDRHPKAWNSLGICLSRQGRNHEAYDCFQNAINLAPDMAEALMNWALVLQNANDIQGAEAKLEQALVADPQHLPSFANLGTLLTKASKFQRAEEVYFAMVNLVPKDPSARLNLALVRLRLGKKEAAITEFQQCLQLDPNNQLAKTYLQQLR